MSDIELIEVDGELVEARQLSNGTYQRVSDGRFLTAPTNPEHLLNSDRARELIHKRWDDINKARQQGLIEAVREDGFEALDINQADEYIFKVLAREVLLSSEVPGRDRVQALKALYGYSGRSQREDVVKADVSSTVNVVTFETLVGKIFHDIYGGDGAKVVKALQDFKDGKWVEP